MTALMFRLRSRASASAIFLAAALLLATACGGTAVPSSPTPSATASPSPGASPSPSPAAVEQTIAGVIQDLSSDGTLSTIIAPGSASLAAGLPSLASGDFNGDGVDDIVIGAPFADVQDREDAGAAYVLFGPISDGTIDLEESNPDVVVFGAIEGDNLGFSVLGGDLNGDGVDDLILGAPGVTAGADPRTDQGRVYVFFGGEDLGGEFDLVDEPWDFVATGAEGFSRLGHAIAVGDVNSDGVGDLVLGAPFAGRQPGTPPGSGRTHLGEVYAIFGSQDLAGEVNTTFQEHDFTASGQEEFGEFGVDVAAADVNGDGTDDIIVGAQRADIEGRADAGAIYVFYGGSNLTGLKEIANDEEDAKILGGAAGDGLGFPLSVADFNGDGSRTSLQAPSSKIRATSPPVVGSTSSLEATDSPEPWTLQRRRPTSRFCQRFEQSCCPLPWQWWTSTATAPRISSRPPP